jgi:hypothetical protein
MAWLGELGSALLGALDANAIGVTLGGTALAVGAIALAWRLGWLAAGRRHSRRSGAIGLAALAVGLPLAWYLGSPLFLSSSIDEPPPVVAADASGVHGPSQTPADSSTPSASATPAVPSAAPSSTAPSSPAPPSPTPAPLVARSGAFHGSDDFHFGRGTARLIETAPGAFVVRLEDFAVRNGPDLYVYLSPSADDYARGAIELGRLKADRGNQNYEVPSGTLPDPSRAASVVIWCKQFSHLFATAPLG